MDLIESFLIPKATGRAFVVKAGQVLRLTQPEGPQVIDFDAFTRRPEETLIPAMTRLGIEMHAEPFKRAKPSHAVGGNSNANIRFAERNHSLDIQPRLSMHLPPDHIDRIVNDIALTKLYDELRQAARR